MPQGRAIQAVHGCGWAQQRVEEGRIFFSRAVNCLFFRKASNSEHLAGPAKSYCQSQSVRAAVGEILACETTVKMWQGLLQTRAWLWKVPVVEKGLAKRNCCNGSLATGLLLMSPSLCGALCCGHGVL